MNNFQQSPNSRQRLSTTPRTPTTPEILHAMDYKPRLYEEISIIMRAFGDSLSGQNRDSIILVEKIVIQQLRGIINEVINVAYKRTGNIVPSQCDFEFLMRGNAANSQRFRKYMRSVNNLKSEKKQGLGINFLNRIVEDSSDEEQEIYDAEKTRRLFRADRISQILNPQKYEEFQKARTWSSNVRNKTDMLRKLVEMLQIPKEIQDHSYCLEILLYLTQETIAKIVDFAILTRLNTDNHTTDLEPISSSITNNMLHLCPEVTQGRGKDGIKAITVQEINEAIRRVQTMTTRRLGTSFRSNDMKIPFLAL
ncbi:CLUMA_CG012589, isoform A [Clunio marinus]|uniref:CLUMA_CG012589, isoform A n=1 Tax=Clunio marinus TaxID=568069 RepID=A0A1J1IGE8_9DIPT|nr:CLUMA_CG012589, isoform A [Clunio marinus]